MAGAALVGFCGLALLGGIAMLAVDGSRSRRFAMGPVVGRGFAGLSVRTRF